MKTPLLAATLMSGLLAVPAAAWADAPEVVLHEGKVYANIYIDDGDFQESDRKLLVPATGVPIITGGPLDVTSTYGPFSLTETLTTNAFGTYTQTVSYDLITDTRTSLLPATEYAEATSRVDGYFSEILLTTPGGSVESLFRIAADSFYAENSITGGGDVVLSTLVDISNLSLSGSFLGGGAPLTFNGLAARDTLLYSGGGLSVVLNKSFGNTDIAEGPPLIVTFDRFALGSEFISGSLVVEGSAVREFNFTGPGIPEPQTWALMIGGFGLAGTALRRRRAILRA